MAGVFVEQPLASPGSANNILLINIGTFLKACFDANHKNIWVCMSQK